MTVPRVLEISEYWSYFPPLNEAFATFIGAATKPSTALSAPAVQSIDAATGRASADGNEGNDAEFVRALMAAGLAIPNDVQAAMAESS